MKRQIILTAHIDLDAGPDVDSDPVPGSELEQRMESSLMDAVANALDAAENNGFSHPMGSETTVAVEDLQILREPPRRVRMECCDRCGSHDLRRNADLSQNPESGEWEVVAEYDSVTCEACAETRMDAECRPVPRDFLLYDDGRLEPCDGIPRLSVSLEEADAVVAGMKKAITEQRDDEKAGWPQWLIDAETEDAVVEIVDGVVHWKSGIWHGGVWHDGVWHGGVWHRGVWHGGEWHRGEWRDGVWLSGYWRRGTWRRGTWHRGTWYRGIWHDGVWHDGIWHDGEWRDGYWHGGVWRGGEWRDGHWLSGEWRDGYWHGGVWRGGLESGFRCKWILRIQPGIVTIGCKTRTVEEWDRFFASGEVIETPRDTEAFRLIERAYRMAKVAAET